MKNAESKVITKDPNQTSILEEYQHYQDLLNVIEENHQKDNKRMYLFFIFLFFALVAVVWISLVFIDGSFISELRSGNNSLMKNTDYLELVLPILIAIIAGFIAFLGMNRLKDMDTQVSQMRSSINTELDKEIGRIASLRSDLAEHIDVAVSNKTQSFAEEMEKRLEAASQDGVKEIRKSKDNVLCEIETSKQAFTELAEQAKSTLAAFDNRYSWLLSNNQETQETFLKEVATVFDVHQAIEAMWNSDEKPKNIAELTRRYVAKVTANTSDLRGDDDDYHNLAAECARHYLYDLACKVCETGLEFFPKNINLLSDWIQYGTKMGDIDVVTNKPLKDLLTIEKTHWNWRAFDFTVDFYLFAGMFEEAESLADDFVLYCPYEERAYRCQAEVYQHRYAKEDGIQKTIAALKTAVDKNINCPMCASKLAEILSDCGYIDEALVAANRAILELSQEQPSVNYSYVVYRRALIQDRLAYKATTEDLDAHNIAVKAAVDYQVAIRSGQLSPITLRQAKVRYDMLRIYFEIENDELGINSLYESGSVDEIIEALKEMSSLPDS